MRLNFLMISVLYFSVISVGGWVGVGGNEFEGTEIEV